MKERSKNIKIGMKIPSRFDEDALLCYSFPRLLFSTTVRVTSQHSKN